MLFQAWHSGHWPVHRGSLAPHSVQAKLGLLRATRCSAHNRTAGAYMAAPLQIGWLACDGLGFLE